MTPVGGVVLCLAYILGLAFASVLSPSVDRRLFLILALGLGAIGAGIAAIAPRFWRTGPQRRLWLTAATILFLAPLYFQLTVPQPTNNDISQFVAAQTNRNAQQQIVTVRGKIISALRLTRSKRTQFWFNAIQLDEVAGGEKPARVGQNVGGKLYVTVPLLQATGLNPGQEIDITGSLYKPKPAANPGSFDFQAYLAKEGAFAGLAGRTVNLPEEQTRQKEEQTRQKWGWWAIRQRIIRAQTRWLGVPEGPLVSAMVMGSQTVNLYLSAAIRDQFARIGLAHAFAASGFQVSLILAIVRALTGRFSERIQFICGVAALLVFLGLTGPQPPVLRAIIMGIAALIALVAQRKIKPFGSLLVAATLLLLVNPLWIQDLSFQLSFLATLGLLVTVPALMKRLDWLPQIIAAAIAVPMAASIWTLPLQLYAFNVVSPYSILVNVITIPLVTVISIGGFISAIAALIFPLAGSALALLLYYPTHWLVGLVEFFGQLPGNSVAVGTLSIWQLLALYGLIGMVLLLKWWQQRWWLAIAIAASLVVLPVWYAKTTLVRVTVLATEQEPVLIIQDRGKLTLVNSDDARFTILPFLQQQGINHIDWAIDCCKAPLTKATDNKNALSSDWFTILERLPIVNFYDDPNRNSPQNSLETAVKASQGTYQSLSAGQNIQAGSTVVKLFNAQFPLLQFEIQGQNWVMLGDLPLDRQRQLVAQAGLSNIDVLAWSGDRLSDDLLKRLQPKVAIASSNTIDPDTVSALQQSQTQLFWTSRDGAIQWTPRGGFETTVELTEDDASLL
jgi:competence protein ComEC